MRQAVRFISCTIVGLLFLPLCALAQDAKPKSSEFKGGDKESTTGAVFKTFFSLEMWWFWLGLIVVAGLLGFLYYQRNKTDD